MGSVEERTHREEPLIQDQQREREQYQKEQYANYDIHNKTRTVEAENPALGLLGNDTVRKRSDPRGIIWQYTEYFRQVARLTCRVKYFLQNSRQP